MICSMALPIANFHFAKLAISTDNERGKGRKKGVDCWILPSVTRGKVLFARFNLNSKLAGVSVSQIITLNV